MRGARLRTLALALAGVSAAGLVMPFATAAHAQEANRRNFNIPAQDMASALETFGRQSGRDIMFDRGQVANLRSNAVRGSLEPGEALRRLVNGSGLLVNAPNTATFVVGRGSGEAVAGSAPAEDESANREIVVTGTNIRGGSAPAGSHVITVTRNQIDQSGYATVQGILSTLPQNFGIVGETSTEINDANDNKGATVELRGLGANSTLILVNGRRQAAGGSQGNFVDISSIPTSAVDRIEILTDGASAIYGSDAIGGVVNILLRRDFRGAETRARYGFADGGVADEIQLSQLVGTSWGTGSIMAGLQYYRRDRLPYDARERLASDGDQRRFGGGDYRTFGSNPGIILSPTGTPAFAIPENQNGTGLTVSALLPGVIRYNNSSERNDLLPRQTVYSAFFSASQEIDDNLEVFADGRYGRRNLRYQFGGQATTLRVPSTNPFYVNPFGGTAPVSVAYSFIDDLGPTTRIGRTDTYTITLGANLRLGSGWTVSATGSDAYERSRTTTDNAINFVALNAALSNSNPATAFNPFGDGSNTNPATIESIKRTVAFRGVSRVDNATLIGSGPLFELGGGSARLALGGEYRHEYFLSNNFGPTVTRDRDVRALFGELSLPLFTDTNAVPGIRHLEFSLAARYEDYSDFGTTFNPKIGARWEPFAGVALRGTWGTSFKAPRFSDTSDLRATQSFIVPVPDPRSPTGTTNALFLCCNNPGLGPERADIWTAGIDVRPRSLPRVRASATYFHINYKGKIEAAANGNVFGILNNETIYASVINRDPTAAELAELCSSPTFLSNCVASPPGAIVDIRLRNLALVRTSGVDFELNYTSPDTRSGVFGAGINATYTVEYRQQVTSTSPTNDVVDTVGRPLRFRARGNLSWTRAGWSAGAFINYAGAYRDIGRSRRVDSWTTFDLNLGYNFPEGEGPLSGTRIAVTATNVFNNGPPFVDTFLGFDSVNGNIVGRVLAAQITKRW